MIERLLELESSLFKLDNMKDIDYLRRVIHEDFLEFGTSGAIYHKKEVIQLLSEGDEDRLIQIHYPTLKPMGTGRWLLHYISYNEASKSMSNRTSIWVEEDGEMKLFFHQGTAADEIIPY